MSTRQTSRGRACSRNRGGARRLGRAGVRRRASRSRVEKRDVSLIQESTTQTREFFAFTTHRSHPYTPSLSAGARFTPAPARWPPSRARAVSPVSASRASRDAVSVARGDARSAPRGTPRPVRWRALRRRARRRPPGTPAFAAAASRAAWSAGLASAIVATAAASAVALSAPARSRKRARRRRTRGAMHGLLRSLRGRPLVRIRARRGARRRRGVRASRGVRGGRPRRCLAARYLPAQSHGGHMPLAARPEAAERLAVQGAAAQRVPRVEGGRPASKNARTCSSGNLLDD